MSEEFTYDEIYRDFCNWSPKKFTNMIVNYKPWGHSSICVWLSNGHAYKCKRHSVDRFSVQCVSEDDIKKKYNL